MIYWSNMKGELYKMYLVDRECVVFDIPDTTKDEVIKKMISKLAQKGSINDAEEFYQNVLSREKICATAIGNEMGLPHGKTANVLRPAICFGRLVNPIIWNEKTGERVKFVILIAVPEENTSNLHMKVISSLARKLMHDEYRKILLSGSQEEVFEFLNTAVEK